LFDDPAFGAKAKELHEDALALLSRIAKEGLLRAKGVYGFFPAASDGDDVLLFTDDSRTSVLARVLTLRQQMTKKEGDAQHALADFVAPIASGRPDALGLFAVTSGHGLDALCATFEADHDDYSSILAKALADRLAEAFAEM